MLVIIVSNIKKDGTMIPIYDYFTKSIIVIESLYD